MYCGHCGNEVTPHAVACLRCGAMPTTGRSFCQHCAHASQNAQAVICVACGSALGGTRSNAPGGGLIYPSNPPKDPVLMGILSGCCIAGIGQLVLGQTVKGVVILLVALGFGTLSGFIAVPFLWIFAGIDAYLIAQKLKAGRPVGEWEFF